MLAGVQQAAFVDPVCLDRRNVDNYDGLRGEALKVGAIAENYIQMLSASDV